MFSFLSLPHSLVPDNHGAASPPSDSSSSSSSLLPDAGLVATADLNDCNQWMNSNQQPCMTPVLSTNQTAASHSQLITMCLANTPFHSHLEEEALICFFCFWCWVDRRRSQEENESQSSEETVCTKVQFTFNLVSCC